ncbi:serine/threonine-protein kinase [Sorangium sp. So ce1078]|uniref:serine/threonine-protein kinase n=1 Tax=Sorangium sp. So ce1078 TaxID=3133329 RepID=UPI003F616A76
MRISEDPGPGQRLGRYELLRLIGEGGMAQVWAARMEGSRGFHKVVALKTLIPALARDPQFQRMFLDEANLAAKIHHRNVVEILDLGDTDGVLFLVMEWIDGQTMHRLLRPGLRPMPISPAMAARVVADAAHGLHAAHELHDERGVPLGIVHRDVCPQNILIDRDGTVKVADFGIVKAFERLGDTTQTGEIKGKGEYMSPEQAQGHPVDRRSDIFSLGVVLFEAVTGALPFQVLHDLVLPQTGVPEPPRPTLIAPHCPRDLEEIILKALARDPRQRFQTAGEMASALEDFLMRRSGVVTTAQVAELLMARCGDKLEEERQMIAAAIVPQQRPGWRPKPGATLSAGPPSEGRPRGSRTPRRGLGGLMRAGSDALRPVALPWLVASVSTGVAVASLMFVALSRPRDHRPLVDPIAVQTQPSVAVVKLNGVVLGVGSQVIARPKPGVSLLVEARSSDGVSQTVEITSESPARIQINLEPKGEPGEGTAAPPGSGRAPAAK